MTSVPLCGGTPKNVMSELEVGDVVVGQMAPASRCAGARPVRRMRLASAGIPSLAHDPESNLARRGGNDD